MKKKFINFKQFMENAPTNNAGAGQVAAIGVGPQGDPPGKKFILFKKIETRKIKIK
jgi:hypothetical protein